MKSFFRINRILLKVAPVQILILMISSIIMGLSNGVSFLVNQMFYGAVYDSFQGNINLWRLSGLIMLIVVIEFFYHGYYVVSDYLNLSIERQIKLYYCTAMNKKIEKLDMESFESKGLYDNISLAIQGIENNSFMQAIQFMTFIPFFIATVLSLICTMASFNITAMLIVFFSMLPVFICKIVQGKKYFIMSQDLSNQNRRVSYFWRLITDRNGNRDFRLLNTKDYICDKYVKLRDDRDAQEYKYHVRYETKVGLFNMINPIGMIISIILIGIMTLQGDLHISVFASMITVQIRLREVVELFFISITNMVNGAHFLKYTDEFAKMPEQLKTEKRLEGPICEITFENVSFAYPTSDRMAIDNISLNLHKGEKIAIVGNNGAGKSTFAKLLLALYKPVSGCIRFNGIDAVDLDTSSVHQDMMAVFQNFAKLSMTLRENLAESNIEQVQHDNYIEKVMRESDFEMDKMLFPNGLNTRFGREFSGVEISGGQWQMIAITRGAMKPTSLVIYDEPTAALDPLNEANMFQKAWKLANPDNIMVIISHRISSAQDADRILVFDQGKIVEEGSHEELIKRNGQYATMYKKQAQWYK